jgi:hypothetical protein
MSLSKGGYFAPHGAAGPYFGVNREDALDVGGHGLCAPRTTRLSIELILIT